MKRCSWFCHYCKAMGGAVHPGCMGTAAFANGPKDKSRCTCGVHIQFGKYMAARSGHQGVAPVTSNLVDAPPSDPRGDG